MSVAGAAPVLSTMNGVVCCPTCGRPAIVEGRFRVHGTGGSIGRLRISCIDGHGWLMLADRVRQVEPWEGIDDQQHRHETSVSLQSETITMVDVGPSPG